MPVYDFFLNDISITNTRARHNDTDFASLSLQVGGNQFGTRTWSMGDVNNGLYFGDPALRFGPIQIDDPKTPIGLALQVVNAGNGSPDVIMGRLQNTGDVLAGTVAGVGASDVAAVLAGAGASSLPAGGTGLWLLLAAGGIEGLNLLWSWLAVDCDGPCAIDLVLTSRLEFDQLTAVPGRYDLTRFYPGLRSPAGCGSNSRYTVTLAIVRDDAMADLATSPTCLIVNQNSALCLDVPGSSQNDGQRIQQFQLNYGDNQKWTILPTDDSPLGPAKTYTIRSASSRKCLDVPDGNPADQTPINQFACHGGPNQQWRFVPVRPPIGPFGPEAGFYNIVIEFTGGCLDVPDGSRVSGQPIQQFRLNGGANQMWKLLP
jgi:hypothetical protein